MTIEVGVRCEVFRSLTMKACPPAIVSVPIMEGKHGSLHTYCVVAVIRQHLHGGHTTCDGIREGGVVRVEAVDAPEPRQDGSVG